MQTSIETNHYSQLLTISLFCATHPSFTQGGIRHLIFTKKPELEAVGAIVHFGRRLLIDETVFLEYVRSGGTRTIAGRA